MEDFSKYNGEGTILRKAQLRLLEMLVEVDRICKKHNIPYWVDGGTALGAARHKGFIPWDDDVDIAVMREDYHRLLKVLEQELPDKYALQNHKNEKCFYFLFSRVVDTFSLFDYGDEVQLFRRKHKHQGIFLDIFFVEKALLPVQRFVSPWYQVAFRVRRGIRKSRLLNKASAIVLEQLFGVVIYLLRKLSFMLPDNKLTFGYGVPFYREFRRNEIIPTKPVVFEGAKVMGPNNLDAYLRRSFGDYMQIPPPNKRKKHAQYIEVYETK